MRSTSHAIPDWEHGELPPAPPLSWRHWTRFIGPGIVMMGVQIGGGEWLLGPEVTARYGGNLMWIATVAIILQVFYNLECGRYALYCGEPIFTGFLRSAPGPYFWMGIILLLNLGALIPGLSTHGAAMAVSLWLNRPPTEADRMLVTNVSYLFLFLVALPMFVGGKVYSMLQGIMTVKVAVVLGFCLVLGICFVSPTNWANIFSGFLKFGMVPTLHDGQHGTVNVLTHWWQHGSVPEIALGNIAVLGAFAGYAGGGGLANATYSNFIRDKGWGMGSQVGAIPSAVGGTNISLSHVGKVFAITHNSLARWRLVALYPRRSNRRLGSRLFHGHGAPRTPVAPILTLFRTPGGQTRLGTIPHHRRRHKTRPPICRTCRLLSLDGHRPRRHARHAPQPDVHRRRRQPPLDRSPLVRQQTHPRNPPWQRSPPRLLHHPDCLRPLDLLLRLALQHLRHSQAHDPRHRQLEQSRHRRHFVSLALD
ncbi:MAG: Nramp family divalent metal transporter [Planctomycetales bacterium]